MFLSLHCDKIKVSSMCEIYQKIVKILMKISTIYFNKRKKMLILLMFNKSNMLSV